MGTMDSPEHGRSAADRRNVGDDVLPHRARKWPLSGHFRAANSDSSVKLLASAGQQPVASSPDSVSSASPLLPPASREALPASRLPRPAVGLVSNRRPTAEQVYDNEIGRLRAIVERRRAQLDPVTISLVERNLKVIDDAIAQCRSALAKDPASRFLMESLNNALENKVELLRTAALLPSRT